MRSLMTKLVLAFLLTSVAGVVLASVIIRQLVTRDFSEYVLKQQRDSFVANVKAYYETNGSLDGVDHWLRQHGESMVSSVPSEKVLSGKVLSGKVPNESMPNESVPSASMAKSVPARSPNGPIPRQGPDLAPAQFGLVDAAGVVIVPFSGHGPGENVRKAEV